MKTPARFRLWVVAALAFMLAAGAVWWVANRLRGTVRLPDGRQVTVLAVTYGTNHTLIEGPLWAKAARRLVSRPRAHQLGLRIYERTFMEPTLIIWTHWRLPPNSAAPRYASVRDRHGLESEPGSAAIDAPVGRTGTAIMAWQFANFPRRQRTFALRFYERETGQVRLLGEVLVANAVRVAASTATAPSPPVAVKQDQIEFTLALLRSGVEVPTNLARAPVLVAPWTEASFEVREDGRLARNWTVHNLRAIGESGNRFQPLYPPVPSTSGAFSVEFPDVLWPDERGWLIRGEFARNADFTETNRWVLPAVPVIRNASGFTRRIFQDVPGLRIDTVELRPTMQFTRRYVRGGFRRTSDLTVVYSPGMERMRLDLVAATDDLGRELRFSGGTEISIGRYLVGLEVSTNSATLDLTFVVHQSREVEFFVQPDWSTNNAVRR